MFRKPRNCTKRIQVHLSPDIQLLLWSLIDILQKKSELDHLQIFDLKKATPEKKIWNQKIIHRQEKPEYSQIYRLCVSRPVDEKVYVVYNGDYVTMMLTSEYLLT